MIKFTILNKDQKEINLLSSLLEKIFMKNNLNGGVVFRTTKNTDFLNYIRLNNINVIFLDIDYNLDVFEIAKDIRKNDKNCYFIFTSSCLDYAVQTFKYKTFDYIVKPFIFEKLENCIIKLFEDIYGRNKKFIHINNKNTIIEEKEIQYIKRDGMKLIFHTSKIDYESYNSMIKIQTKLPENFVRCHKSFIVNILNIDKIEISNNMIYCGKSICYIGPKYKDDFLKKIKNLENIYNCNYKLL